MQLLIAKVDETLFSGEVYSVTLPTGDGEMTILGEHMPLVTVLSGGTIRVRKDRDSQFEVFPAQSGVLEVTREGAVVLL